MGRRRKVYALLTGLLVLTSTLWVAGVAAAELMLLPMSLMGAFTFAARKQVVRERKERDAAIRYWRARTRCMAAHPSRGESATRVQSKTTPTVTARPAVRMDDGVDVAANRRESTAAPAAWSAQPLTLPTYVTAPAATRVPRNLDVASDGVFDREELLRQADEVRRARAAQDERDFIDEFMEQTHVTSRDEVFDQYAPDQRRAANG
jgi:hypothetical protein